VIGFLIISIVFLLAASILISAAEAAIFSLSDGRVRILREEGFRGAERLQAARDRKPRVQATSLLVSTLLNGAAIGLLVRAALQISESANGAFASPTAMIPLVTVGVVIVLLVAELLPRLLLFRPAVGMALRWAPLLLAMDRAVGPLLRPLIPTDARGRDGEEDEDREEREVREISAIGRREGVVGAEEEQLVERVFRLDERSAWDVMTPRVDIYCWRDDTLLRDIIQEIQSVPHSRVPVYGDSVDDITGILSVRDAYEAWVAGNGDKPLSALAREPFFIPGSLPLPRLLRVFQMRRVHLGIVADEFGGTDGLVTLEDVLEELVGEIEDERDVAEETMVRISADELEVDAGIEIRDLNDLLTLDLPEDDARSLNGLVLEELGRVPAQGEHLLLPGVHVRILESSDTQVLRARLKRVGNGTEAPTGGEIEAEPESSA
jgi:CBS domain containing-hemolysin-like protein